MNDLIEKVKEMIRIGDIQENPLEPQPSNRDVDDISIIRFFDGIKNIVKWASVNWRYHLWYFRNDDGKEYSFFTTQGQICGLTEIDR